MNILIAVGEALSCHEAVQAAAARPWPAGSNFLLVTVIDPFFFARAPALLDQAKTCARKQLEHQAQCLRHAGWNTATDVILGNPRRAISVFARDWKADLVMAGSRNLSDAETPVPGKHNKVVVAACPMLGRDRTNER
jgi:nucleotide-binding universal stress UspA family protein